MRFNPYGQITVQLKRTHMKLNSQTFKGIVAVVIIIGTLLWAFDSLRLRSYSGPNLTFPVGQGAVSMTNPSDSPVAVQLVAAGNRAFGVGSTIEGLSGTSTKQGTGSSTTQLFEYSLPAGSSEFTILRGAGVNFVANTPTQLQATVNPMSNDTARTTVLVAIVVIVAALFYMSRLTDHRWLKAWGRKQKPVLAPVPVPTSEGPAARSYGDNRRDS
jgi:preprotein translocase subunit SecE